MADAQGTYTSYFGSGLVSQILTALAVIVILYLSLATGEYMYNTFMGLWNSRLELFPNTYASSGKMYTAVQDPSSSKPLTITMSTNQRSGIEFSYSMFININSTTFSNSNSDTSLHHILHKGYNLPYPLLGPGIFCFGSANTLRVYMNCYNTWNSYTDIPNIPVDKWFHIVVSCKGNTLYVYINGSLKNKMALASNTPPYQNYGNVYLFSPRKMTVPTSTVSLVPDSNLGSSTASSPLTFSGAARGMVSRVYYYSYALTSSEIQTLMNMGPSPNMNGADMSISPYLADTWWTNSQVG